jgi:hypothetical protein
MDLASWYCGPWANTTPREVSIILHSYATSIVIRIFNNRYTLLDLNIDDFKFKPYCTRASSPFIYIPADHVITDVLKMIDNTSLGVVMEVLSNI